MKAQISVFGAALVLAMAGGVATATVEVSTVPVANRWNPADTRYNGIAVGGVGYNYAIGSTEVTVGSYVEFLNAVATTDTYGLYNSNMAPKTVGWSAGVVRTGTQGSYRYSVDAGLANRPINYVSWGDAARFCNWLANDQPAGLQAVGTTESGSYYLNGANTNASLMAIARESNATWVLPTEDEWYKAAYHKNDGSTGNYSDYPNGTDSMTTAQANFASSVGRSTDAGAYGVVSAYGTLDQAGNMYEWNESIVFGSSRGTRGGSLYSSASGVSASSRSGGSATYETDSVGFRVAQVPEPATLLLLSCGAAVGLVRSRRLRKPA